MSDEKVNIQHNDLDTDTTLSLRDDLDSCCDHCGSLEHDSDKHPEEDVVPVL